MTRNYSKNEYLVKHFSACFEESIVSYQSGISLYIEMWVKMWTIASINYVLTSISIN
jgi:hypothetical protein